MRTFRRSFHILLGILALALAFQPPAPAQSTSAIQGTVTDKTGASVPSASVVIHNEATGEERSTSTDQSGLYLVPALPVGRYRVTVTASGLQSTTASNQVLEVGRTSQQNFTLDVASTILTVEVSAQSTMVETGTVTVGSVVNQRTVQEIPLNGRHFVDLGLLIPGSVTPPQNGNLTAPLRGQGSSAFNTAGNREDTVNYMINGVNLNDMVQNQITFQPSISTVQEFKVDNSTYSAEYGRNSGAIVNIATRAGTNGYHGELFEFLRNNDMDARNYFNRKGVEQSPFKRNQFGANAGGPIWKDHTFFFLSYEGLRQRQGLTINQPVLSGAQRQSAQATGNPTVLKLLPLIPQANSGAALFVGSATAPVNVDQGTANISHSFGANDRVNIYYAYQHDIRQEPALQGNNVPGFGDTRQGDRQIMTLNETHVFTPNLVNEWRLGYNRIKISFDPNATLNPADFGMNVGINAPIGLPQMTLRDIGLNFGGPNNFPQGRGDYTAVVSDAVSYIRGKHTLKMGAEARRFNGNAFVATPGTMQFNTVADFIAGQIATFTASPTSNPARVYVLALGAYVQDSYKIARGLTMELGLRYDHFGTPTEANNRFVVFNPVANALVRTGSGIGEVYPPSATNFQPRLGFAWDLSGNGRTILRGAYAILADQPVSNLVSSLSTNPPFANPLAFNGPGTVTFANAITAAASAGSLAPVSVSHDFKNGYMQSWNFNVQHQLTSDIGLMAGYFGNKGTHLRTARNLNQFLPSTSVRPYSALAPASPISPGAALGNITQWESVGNSDYDALWVTASKRMTKSVQFNASYTWSKSIDYTSLNSPTPQSVTLQDSNNVRGDRGLSDFDARHRVVLSGILELPFKGNRAVEGWQFALVTQLQSGNPVNIITTNSSFNGVANTMRPDILGAVPTGIGSALNGNPQYFPAAGCNNVPTAGCLFLVKNGFGGLGRNVIIGPGFEDIDFSIYKNLRITERIAAQFRSDFFNLFNHPNFGQPGRTVSTAAGNTFGQITNTRSPVGDSGSSRQVQVAMKLIF